MVVIKDEVTLTTPIYFIDGKQVCCLDEQTKRRFFKVGGGPWGPDCSLHGRAVYINMNGHRIPVESCLLAELHKIETENERLVQCLKEVNA